MTFLSRFERTQKSRRRPAAPSYVTDAHGRRLPQELAEAPDWLRDDLGVPRAGKPDATALDHLVLQMLIRRQG